MNDLQDVIKELEQRSYRAQYHNELPDQRQFQELCSELISSLNLIDETIHDNCVSQDDYDDLEKTNDKHGDELIKIQKELNAFAARIC